MNPFNITDIFNSIVALNSETLEAFYDSLYENFQLLKKEKDIDNLKVLRNRIVGVLQDDDLKRVGHKKRKDIKKIEELLETMNIVIDEIDALNKEKIQLVDVVAKFRKKNKSLNNLQKDKKRTHILVAKKKSDIDYEAEMLMLQLELAKLQKYIQESGKKVLIIFEGRDAAGKGGNIKRFMESLNPRSAKVVALMKPTEVEKGQWYFQRYIAHLPNAGELVFFDRSWYNRAGVEPVMGFVGKRDYEKFMEDVPLFEKMLSRSGVEIIKFYFSVSKTEQALRFEERRTNPLKQFKLSPIDQFSQKLWDRYTLAEYENFTRTHTDHAPWIVVNSDDKEASRINAIKYLLNQFDYPGKISTKKLSLDNNIISTGREKVRRLEKEIDKDMSLFD